MQDRAGIKNKLMPQGWKGENVMMQSKVRGRMPKIAEVDLPVVDATNLTSDQISALAQPISPRR